MAGDARKWRGPIPACPTCDEDADLCPHDQEHTMTSPTQKRHDEIVALLTDIRDALTRDHLHRLLAEESAAERRDECVDVTECRDCGRSDGGCDRVDTAPAARSSHPGVLWDKIDDLETDVERLTRERDEAQMERSDAVRERDAEVRRYNALRRDLDTWVRGHTYPLRGGIVYSPSQILDRDNKRGRDA